jgi:D-3-phosphoglycerate dehydrogenase / 2-oxoglutarate reductase
MSQNITCKIMAKRILLLQPLPSLATDWLVAQGAELSLYDDGWPADADRIEALLYYSVRVDRELMDRLPALRVIGKRGAGVDTVDLAEADRRGIQVTNVGAGGNANSVSEHALALLMAATRDVVARDAFTRAGNFRRRFELPLYQEVAGSRMGIMGAGQIGRRLTAILHGGLGCEIGVFDPYAPTDDLPARRFDDLAEMFAWADNAIVAAPLTPESRGAVGARELRLLGSEGVLVVSSRGGIVDEAALAAALRAGDIRAAGVDTYDGEPPADDHPFFGLPNIVLSPHVGGASRRSRDNVSLMVAQQVWELLHGRPAPLVGAQPWLATR